MNESTRQSVPNHSTPTFGNPDLPPEGRMNVAANPESLRDDGPRNTVMENQIPLAGRCTCNRYQHPAVLLVVLQHLAQNESKTEAGRAS